MLTPWDPEAHLADVNAWHVAQGSQAQPVEVFPAVGYVEPGVAAGWLYQTDSAVAFLETFVANPAAPKVSRWRAMNRIGVALERAARHLGVRRLIATTKSRGMSLIAIRNGGTYLGPFHVLTKEI
jgi:hypothetical protein